MLSNSAILPSVSVDAAKKFMNYLERRGLDKVTSYIS